MQDRKNKQTYNQAANKLSTALVLPTRTNSDGERGRGPAVGACGREGGVPVARQRARQGQVVVRAPHVLQRLQLVQARAGHAHASVHIFHRL